MKKEIIKIVSSVVVAIIIIVSALTLKGTEHENTWLYITCIWIVLFPLIDLFPKKKDGDQ